MTTTERLASKLFNSCGESMTGEHREHWIALIEASLALFRDGESEGAIIQMVLDCQDGYWKEEGI